MNNDLFDDSVRKQLNGHEAPVPAAAWDNIQNARKKKRPFLFFWFCSLVLLSLVAIMYVAVPSYPAKEPGASANKLLFSDRKEREAKQRSVGVAAVENSIISPSDKNDSSVKGDAFTESLHVQDMITGIKSKLPAFTEAAANGKKKNGFVAPNHNSKRVDAAGNEKTNANDITSTAKNQRQTIAGSVRMKMEAASAEEDNSIEKEFSGANEIALDGDAARSKAGAGDTRDSIFAAANPTDSFVDTVAIARVKALPKNTTKKPGLMLSFGLSPFIPVSHFNQPVSFSRSMQSASQRSTFTTSDFSIRRQPSVSFNGMLKKSLSAKTILSAGLSYTVIKEYITLKGEEITTQFSIVKRLQNGNQLVDDTIATTSRGQRTINAVNSYNFLSIPIGVQYQLLKRNGWNVAMQAGVDISISSKYHNKIEGLLLPVYASGTTTGGGKKTAGIGLTAGLYLRKTIRSRYELFAAPYLQFNPAKIYLDGMPAAGTIHRAGIGLGINYRL